MTQSATPDGLESVVDEAERVRALHALNAFDGPVDPRFERIARLAGLLFKAPRAAVVLVDQDRLFLKAAYGVNLREHPRRGTMADLMVKSGKVVLTGDVTTDPRFADMLPALPHVDVRFFACAPLITPGGQVIGLLSVGDPEPHANPTESDRQGLIDLAAQAMDELMRDAVLANHARRLEIAVEAAGMAEFEWDIETDQVVIEPRLASLTGLVAGAMPGAVRTALAGWIDPLDREPFARALEAAAAGHGDLDVELRWIRPDDGRTVWLAVRAVCLRIGDPPTPRLVGVIQDITERKSEEQRRDALSAELDHRVKNMLASVQAVAHHSARKTTSMDAFLKAFTGRLKAMASAHDLLSATRWGGAYLRDVVGAEMGGLAPDQVVVSGPPLYLTPRAAGAVALALHELAAAALRQGALSTEQGRIDIHWRARPTGGFELDWIESGGPPTAPLQDGFATALLGDITGRELEGRVVVDYPPSGVRARLEAGSAALGGAPEAPVAPSVLMQAPMPPPPPPAAQGPERAEQVAGLRVLIVEDSLLLALELEQGLTELGAIIVGNAAEVDEAMALVDADFDVAVLDANLNGASVVPVARALLERGRPFIFATGYADTAAPAGFDAPIVRKPYNVGQIARALAQVCVQNV
jgi:PAS domain S-box-containing protein